MRLRKPSATSSSDMPGPGTTHSSPAFCSSATSSLYLARDSGASVIEIPPRDRRGILVDPATVCTRCRGAERGRSHYGRAPTQGGRNGDRRPQAGRDGGVRRRAPGAGPLRRHRHAPGVAGAARADAARLPPVARPRRPHARLRRPPGHRRLHRRAARGVLVLRVRDPQHRGRGRPRRGRGPGAACSCRSCARTSPTAGAPTPSASTTTASTRTPTAAGGSPPVATTRSPAPRSTAPSTSRSSSPCRTSPSPTSGPLGRRPALFTPAGGYHTNV